VFIEHAKRANGTSRIVSMGRIRAAWLYLIETPASGVCSSRRAAATIAATT
jgi:hypothetical protein